MVRIKVGLRLLVKEHCRRRLCYRTHDASTQLHETVYQNLQMYCAYTEHFESDQLTKRLLLEVGPNNDH